MLETVRAAILRRWRWVAASAAAIGVYAAIGFFAVPYALQRIAPERLEEALGRKVLIERIRTNPFTLSATVDGFAVLDERGEKPALSWRSLFLNYELWPVLKREQRFRAIRLVEPVVRGGLGRDGTPDFADVAERLRRRQAAEAAREGDAREDERPWTIVVDTLDVGEATVEFRDASRVRPFESTLGPLTLHVESFRTTSDGRSPYEFSGRTERGETFQWSGTLRVAPLRSSGTLVVQEIDLAKYAPYYADVLLTPVRQGNATVRATYDLDLGQQRVVRVTDGALRVRSLALHDPAGGERLLSVPSLDVSGIQLDAVANALRVGRVEAAGGVVSVRRDGEGRVNLERAVAAPRPASSSRAAEAAPPLRYAIDAIALRGWRVELDDRLPPRPVALAVTDVEVTLEQVRSAPGAESSLTASLTWPGGGSLRVAGAVSPIRPAATLSIDGDALALAPVEPYLALYGEVRARIAEGTARGKLKVALDLARPEAPSYAVTGDAAVDGLVLLEEAGEEVVRWRTLEANGIDLRSPPAGVKLSVLRLDGPRLRIVRRPDETTNLASLAGTPPSAAPGGRPGAKVSAGAQDAATAGEAAQPTPFRIDTIAVDGGRVTVSDRTVKPAAVLRYTGVRARISNFSSDAAARSAVDVRALVEGTAPFRVTGTLNPRLVGDVTDLRVRSRGIDLTPMGPYSSRYVGYALERGKMDLDLRYRVKERHLKAKNVVRVDRLSLGDKSGSPDAPSFPMGLALAVLTDRHGVMLLDVPVEGNLDDPEFKLGKVIWRAVLNVLGKVATAPFTALAGLFGGGGDAKLDLVEFAPGAAGLEQASLAKLDSLAKLLADRPGLKLEVAGVPNDAADREALGREALRSLVAQEKWRRSKPKKGAAPPPILTVTDAEYPRFLALAYESAVRTRPPQVAPGEGHGEVREGAPAATAGAPGPGAAARRGTAPTPEEMEALLLEGVDLGVAMRSLASERAGAVREQLLARQIDQSRLFLTEGGEGGKEDSGPGVRLTLK